MKILNSLMIALFALSFGLQAQSTDAVYKEAEEKTERLAKVIEMTDDEKTRVLRIAYEAISNGQRLQKMEASAEEKAKMVEAYEKRKDERMKELLGEERFAKYLEVTAKEREKARSRATK